jgi:hypothetical protein
MRGEVAFVIGTGVAAPDPDAIEDSLDDRIDALLAQGSSTAAIATQLAAEGAGERQTLYARVGARRSEGNDATGAGTPEP